MSDVENRKEKYPLRRIGVRSVRANSAPQAYILAMRSAGPDDCALQELFQ